MAAWSPRANEIFADAVERPAAQRPSFVLAACGGDASLLREVEALLAAHDGAGGFLSGPPLPAAGPVVRALAGVSDGETSPGAGAAEAAGEAAGLPERYRMDGQLGRGGMGEVLRGHDAEMGRDVAVKVLLETHAGRTELVQRFVEEARIAGQLQHPGIVPVYEMGGRGGSRPYFTMKLVKGRTLADLLKQRQSPAEDLPRFVSVFEAVCQTMAFAHDKGVIHRDLKPANVMVGAFGEVQVMDWGLAKVLAKEATEEAASIIATARGGDGDTEAGTVLGTPSYMAPEQARGEVDLVDERADVFGLGAILCEILTGMPPFPGKNAEAMRLARKGDLAGARARLDACGADAGLAALARRCLTAEPAGRPRHAGEVAEAATAHQRSVAERLRQAEMERARAEVKAAEEAKRRRVQLALAASVLATLLLGGGGYVWIRHQHGLRLAARARVVDEGLGKVAVLVGKAASAPGDLSAWTEAGAEMKHAEALLGQGEDDAALRERVAAARAGLDRGRRKAELAARDALAERTLLAQLEAIRGERSEHWDSKRADREYADAFRAFGVDLDVATAEEAGARLGGRPGTVEIVAALDEWCRIRRTKFALDKGVRSWQQLAEAARRADPDPWRNRLRETFGRPLVAAEVLKKQAEDVATLERQPAESLLLLARLLALAGEKKRSIEVLRFAWQRFPGDFWVNLQLTGAFKGREEEVRFATATVAARPGSAAAHYNLGVALADILDYDGAIAAYHQAIKRDPKFASAHGNLGRALYKQGKLEEAIGWLQKAIAIAPRLANAHNNLGAVFDEQGKAAKAIAAFREAIRIDPNMADAHHNLGRSLYKQGKVDDAIACYREAIERDRKVANSHRELGNALNKQGKTDEAIAAYREAIAVRPKDVAAHESLGAMLVNKMRDLDEAIDCYQKAIALGSKAASTWYGLGRALEGKGKVEDAIARYREAIKAEPKHVQALAALGLALYRNGEFAEAEASLRRCLALLPPDHGFRKFLSLQLQQCRLMLALEQKLPDVLAGKLQPADAAERIGLASICVIWKWHLAAARFAADAFAAAPKLATNLDAHVRYNAACSAALAAAGKGRDAGMLDDKTRRALRRQALTWLRAELAARQRQLKNWWPGEADKARAALANWQNDPDLAGLRDADARKALPPEERQACERLWADVKAALPK